MSKRVASSAALSQALESKRRGKPAAAKRQMAPHRLRFNAILEEIWKMNYPRIQPWDIRRVMNAIPNYAANMLYKTAKFTWPKVLQMTVYNRCLFIFVLFVFIILGCFGSVCEISPAIVLFYKHEKTPAIEELLDIELPAIGEFRLFMENFQSLTNFLPLKNFKPLKNVRVEFRTFIIFNYEDYRAAFPFHYIAERAGWHQDLVYVWVQVFAARQDEAQDGESDHHQEVIGAALSQAGQVTCEQAARPSTIWRVSAPNKKHRPRRAAAFLLYRSFI